VQTETEVVLNLEELRSLTMNDRQLMGEILQALIEDASRHAGLLEAAVADVDAARSARVARQASRACGNIGAVAVAAAFRRIERHAAPARIRGLPIRSDRRTRRNRAPPDGDGPG
jgi:HPt (histidine-containing phosphotransfer) domain-containing protein